MSVPAPHFLLFSEAAIKRAPVAAGPANGRWRFVLQSPDGRPALEAADDDSAGSHERLELLAIVRGLEALDQPSKVTLLTGSRDIQRGLQFGLAQWRENDWQWERYGQMTPVKNSDLWRRIDRLTEIHDVACRPRRLEQNDDLALPPTRWMPCRSGQVVRVDQPDLKSEVRSTQRETNSRSKARNRKSAAYHGQATVVRGYVSRISSRVLRTFRAYSFRVSSFVLRALATRR